MMQRIYIWSTKGHKLLNHFRYFSTSPPQRITDSNQKDAIHVTQTFTNQNRHFAFSNTPKGEVIRQQPVIDMKYVYNHYLDAMSYFLPKGHIINPTLV